MRDDCDPTCPACMKADQVWASMPDDYRPGLPPECVVNWGEGREFEGYICICEEN